MKNWLERTPRTMGDWLALAAGTALLLAAAGQLPGLLRAAAGLLALLAPFGWGLVLAYVLDIPTRFLRQSCSAGGAAGRWRSAMRCCLVCWPCWRRWSCPSWCRA